MNDIEFDFVTDCAEKKNVARSAKYRKGTVFGPKGCHLPHENMTKKEINAMHGEVKSYNMASPVSYGMFKFWPDDLKRNYILGLQEKYGAGDTAIAEMMGTGRQTIATLRRFLRVPPMKKGHQIKDAEWEKFLNGVDEEPEIEAEPAEEQIEQEPETEPTPTSGRFPWGSSDKKHVKKASFEIEANDWEQLMDLVAAFDISNGAKIQIVFECV